MREVSHQEGGSPIRALTAGMIKGIALFLLAVAALVLVLTLAGLGLFIVDGDSFNDDFSPAFMLMAVPTVLAIGGVGWLLWRFAARYDAGGG